MTVRIGAFLAVLVLAACGGSEPLPAAGEGASAEPAASQPDPAGSQEDDPDNPWVLGYRWSGSPGMKIRVEWATRGPNYDVIKESGSSTPFGKAEQNHEVSAEPEVALATVFVKGLKIRATVVEGAGTLNLEMIRGRLADPTDPAGGIEVREVLKTGSLDAGAGPLILAAGETFDEQPSHW